MAQEENIERINVFREFFRKITPKTNFEPDPSLYTVPGYRVQKTLARVVVTSTLSMREMMAAGHDAALSDQVIQQAVLQLSDLVEELRGITALASVGGASSTNGKE